MIQLHDFLRQINQLNAKITSYHLYACPSDSYAKIIDGGRITCVIRPVAYGERTARVPAKALGKSHADRIAREK